MIGKGDFGDRIESLLADGLQEAVYPGTVLVVARGGEVLFEKAAGYRILIPRKAPMQKDTIFDLASLTKPMATAVAVMVLIDHGKLDLDEPLETLLSQELPRDKKRLTPRWLLSHSAGLADWNSFYLGLESIRPEERKQMLRKWIMDMPLVYPPGKGVLYSDLGFMVLEWIVEKKSGLPLPRFLDRHVYGPLHLGRTLFATRPTGFGEEAFAATEDCPWRKRVILGEVHDENAFVVGGYSGHAGLFGSAADVYRMVNHLWEHYVGARRDIFSPETVKRFFTRQNLVEESTFALGWDTPSAKGSSAGRYFSSKSVGHLGFTGTSVWMDLEKDILVVFLTNRIHPSRDNEKIRQFRPRLHDAIMEELGRA
jgi:CubicO group peptidase (beta-lactamase class C family)